MEEINFSDAQRALIENSGSVFIPACPGAGKTQSIVERFIQRPGVSPRQGVALLSFTNAAINEARHRCAGRLDLLASPNFVGTIDSFINRYIVTPLYVALTGTTPTFKDSWSTVQGTAFKVPGMPTIEFQLSWFAFDHDGSNATFIEHQMTYMQSRMVAGMSEQQRKAAAEYASRRVRRFTDNGVMDCAATRVLMQHYLSDETNRARLGELMAARFGLVIVDEVQDCSDSDIFLINFLLDFGIEVVMVGDLDQSIYNFRGSSIEAVEKLVSRVPGGMRFDGNYRSAPAICSVVDSLRAGTSTDKPLGKWQHEPHAVMVLPVGGLTDARLGIIKVAESMGFSAGEIKVLAYAEKNARACAGASPPGDKKGGKFVQLAQAAATLQDLRASARARTQAMQMIEGILRELADEEHHAIADAEFLGSVGLTPRTFRDGCLRLASRTSPFDGTPSAFRGEMCEGIKALGWNSWIKTSSLRIPPGGQWPVLLTDEPDALDWSTIHGFKGLQSPVAAVAIPASKWPSPTDGVGLWNSGDAGEHRRVLYVGASRAERLLILVTESFQTQRVVSCLQRDGVPFEVFETN
ncbi:UvrD-helicase domain-containing protein [Dactylosporangium sp. CA-139066]|uniref:UvrD-helicase domain-containing protein n=1 Tax=Dactylosporangium sp. CA-139066 TaxID=3239930 RepID=UPI003D8B7666